jgi:DNA polymerase-4
VNSGHVPRCGPKVQTRETTPPLDIPSPLRRILLVDCDAFYVQVARLLDPEGAGKARLLIVGGSPSGRGVVTSASYETRAYGVHSAMPTAQALRLCPNATVVGVPRKAVVEKSREVAAVLRDLAPLVQAASIDEFYLDLTGTERLFHGAPLDETARRFREEVLARTHVSVSIGGGTRRVIAKLAAGRAKPGGVYVVAPGGEQAFLNTLELGELPGVGPTLADALAKRGLVRVEDALGVQLEWMQRWFGTRRGAWLHRRVRGLDDSEVDPHEERKSISSERTFFRDLDDDPELERRLLELCCSVAATLRGKGLRARTVTVKLRDDDFNTRQHARTAPEGIQSDAAVFELARGLLRELRVARRRPARLVGVGLSGLHAADEPRQLALFEEAAPGAETERDRAVAHALDRLRSRFGDDAIRPGRLFGGRGGHRRDDEEGLP